MATRLYFMPAVTEILGRELTKHPKYDALYGDAPFQVTDFGTEPWFIVAVDVPDATHTLIAANADVIVIPTTVLDTAVTAIWATAVKPRLEAVNLPAHWLTAQLTHRQVLRVIFLMFQFVQRLSEARNGASLFSGTVTLDTKWADLPNATRQEITSAANSLGMPTDWITPTTLIRDLLKGFADRWFSEPIQFMDVTI